MRKGMGSPYTSIVDNPSCFLLWQGDVLGGRDGPLTQCVISLHAEGLSSRVSVLHCPGVFVINSQCGRVVMALDS